jgi:hypothetical protein
MADIINLRQARKAAKRSRDADAATANRAKFGQTKADRAEREAEALRQARLLDGAKREAD